MNSYHLDRWSYENIQSRFQPFILEVASYHELEPKDLRWWHHIKYVSSLPNIAIEEIDSAMFANVAKGISGRTDIIEGVAIISYVKEKTPGRTAFTLSHEIIHTMFHYYVNDLGEYEEALEIDEGVKEVEADIGASLLMAHDDAIDDLIERGYTFNQMCDTLGYSRNGLHSRLINYFEHSSMMNKYAAKNLVNEYRFNNSAEVLLVNEFAKEYKYEIYREMMSDYSSYFAWGI